MDSIAVQKTYLGGSAVHKPSRWLRWFIISAGVVYLITGLAKLLSALGESKILILPDPIFSISYRHLMLIASGFELIVSGFCFFSRTSGLQVKMVAWLATTLLAYRLNLWATNWQAPCSCMGNLTDAIHISPQVADLTMKIVLAYLLVGSWFMLFANKYFTSPQNIQICSITHN